MALVNLTPHEITIHTETGAIILPPSGRTVRLDVARVPVGELDGIQLFQPILGGTVGLPDQIEGTTLIVSALVAEGNPDRRDLASPGELIRNVAGQPVGCRGLSVYWRHTAPAAV